MVGRLLWQLYKDIRFIYVTGYDREAVVSPSTRGVREPQLLSFPEKTVGPEAESYTLTRFL